MQINVGHHHDVSKRVVMNKELIHWWIGNNAQLNANKCNVGHHDVSKRVVRSTPEVNL